ncbi:MAG TPA: DUF1638 domain-containing protein [Acidimicrobiia bacterium]
MAPPEAAPPGGRPPDLGGPSVLVIGCGALANELLEVVSRNGLRNIRVECLPAILHNRPEKIPGAVRSRLEAANGFDRVFVAYGDCGTGGELDKVLEEFDVDRLPGAHCYQFFAGIRVFDEMHEAEPGTLYLTDYLTRHFDRLIWRGLGLDRWPNLLDDYFGNYQRIVYLAQTEDPILTGEARQAADRLGLDFEWRFVGYGEMEPELLRISRRESVRP